MQALTYHGRKDANCWSMRLLLTDPGDIRIVAGGNWNGLSRAGVLRQSSQVVAPNLG